jgi:hypothetical protein
VIDRWLVAYHQCMNFGLGIQRLGAIAISNSPNKLTKNS